MLRRPILALVVALLLAVGGGAAYSTRRQRLPARRRRRRLRHRLPHAGGHGARGDRRARLRKVEAILSEDAGGRDRSCGAPAPRWACSRRSRTAATSWCGSSRATSAQRSAEEIIDDLRDKVTKAVPDTDIEFVQLLQDMLGDLEGTPTPIEVKIFGDDGQRSSRCSGDRWRRSSAKEIGVVDIVGLQKGGPEVTWQVDPVAAGRLGLTVEQVATQLSDAWLGEIATDYLRSDRTIPVRVRYPGRGAVRPGAPRRDDGARRRRQTRRRRRRWRRSRASGQPETDAREPAPDGARQRPAREARPRQRRRGRSDDAARR